MKSRCLVTITINYTTISMKDLQGKENTAPSPGCCRFLQGDLPFALTCSHSLTCRADYNFKGLVEAAGVASPQEQLLVPVIIVAAISPKTDFAVGPIRVVDLSSSGEDELLVDAGGIACTKGQGSTGRRSTQSLITPVIETQPTPRVHNLQCVLIIRKQQVRVLRVVSRFGHHRAAVDSAQISVDALNLESKGAAVTNIGEDAEA